jgi:hypothetical protein
MSHAHLFNLLWVYPIPPGPEDAAPVARQDTNTVRTGHPEGLPAIILYPVLLTPASVVGNEDLELMLLMREDAGTLTVEDVNRQLKLLPGLDPMKRYADFPLFADDPASHITLESIPFRSGGGSSGSSVASHDRFEGLISPYAFSDLLSTGLAGQRFGGPLYRVRISNPPFPFAVVTDRAHNVRAAGKVTAVETHDLHMRQVIYPRHGPRIAERGMYCFAVGSRDVSMTHIDLNDPVQAYHPVFLYPSLEFANYGFLSDIHVSSRQQILAKTEARVIDYQDASGTPQDTAVSPHLGPIVNVCSENLKTILRRMGRSGSGVDIVLVGGDLIDYNRNAYARSLRGISTTQVWTHLALDDDYQDDYQAYVDFIAFYSIVVDFYRRFGKPIFALTGNHDCYAEPYGISPRVGWVRANAGIPADHNMTLYEAILSFGETYGEIKDRSNFKPHWYRWFYTVLTPFSDFAVKLPRQYLTGLGWGYEEDLLDAPGTDHGFGHLPRADEPISNAQLALVERAVGSGKKVILFSHFTFVSYMESIPMQPRTEGDVEFDTFADFGDHDLGTFERNRQRLYEEIIARDRRIQVAFTGHSHRHGLYLVTRADYFGDNSVKTLLYDFPEFATAVREQPDALEPAIIVSDSAGPVPRYNFRGEFQGQGSCAPGGSMVTFDAAGDIAGVRAVSARVKPRFVVAVDFLDVVEEEDVITAFDSDSVSTRDETIGDVERYAFDVQLNGLVVRLSANRRNPPLVTIADLRLYCKPGASDDWERIVMSHDKSAGRWVIDGSDVRTFRRTMAFHRGSGLFMAVRFQCASAFFRNLYDFDSYWTFPCRVRTRTSGGLVWQNRRYFIERTSPEKEVPDFDWRRRLPEYQP